MSNLNENILPIQPVVSEVKKPIRKSKQQKIENIDNLISENKDIKKKRVYKKKEIIQNETPTILPNPLPEQNKEIDTQKNSRYEKHRKYFVERARINSLKKNYGCNEKQANDYASILDKLKIMKTNPEIPKSEYDKLLLEREKIKEKFRKLRQKNIIKNI